MASVKPGWASPLLEAQGAYLRSLGAAGCAEVLELDGIFAVRTGLVSNAENGVVGAASTAPSQDAVAKLVAWFSERDLPAAWLCAEGALRSEWAEALEAAGCRSERAGWEMRSQLETLDVDSWSSPDEIEVAPVSSETDLDAWLDVAQACAWFDTAAERAAVKRLYLDLIGSTTHSFQVARKGRTAIGMASSFHAGELALLTAVAVLPAARRRGVGRALALTRLRAARDHGCATAVLAPSPDGAALYRSLGFQTHRQPPDRWFYLPAPGHAGAPKQ